MTNSPFSPQNQGVFVWEGRPAWPSIWPTASLPLLSIIAIIVYVWNDGGQAIANLFRNFHWLMSIFLVQLFLVALSELFRRATVYEVKSNRLTIKRRLGTWELGGRNSKFNKVQQVSTNPSVYIGLNAFLSLRGEENIGDIVLELPIRYIMIGTGKDRQTVARQKKIRLKAIKNFVAEGEVIFGRLSDMGIMVDNVDT